MKPFHYLGQVLSSVKDVWLVDQIRQTLLLYLVGFLSIDVFTLTDCKEQNIFLHISFKFNIILYQFCPFCKSFNSLLIVKMIFFLKTLYTVHNIRVLFTTPPPPLPPIDVKSRVKVKGRVQLLWTSGGSLSFVHSTFENHLLMRDQFSHSNPSVNWCMFSIRSR